MMDPIIKTTRIAPSAFSLNLRHPKAGGGFTLDSGKPAPKQTPAPDPHAKSVIPPTIQESILTPAAINKLVPHATEAEHQQAAPETIVDDSSDRERQLQQAYEQAREEGFRTGLEAGRKESRQELEQALKQIGDLLHSLAEMRGTLWHDAEDGAVEVVFEAVTKMVGYASTDRQIAYNLVREAIEQVKGRDRLVIRVSNQDYDMVHTALSHAGTAESLAKSLTVVADNLVQLGGCLIETDSGSLDARLEIQLQRLRDMLLGVRNADADA